MVVEVSRSEEAYWTTWTLVVLSSSLEIASSLLRAQEIEEEGILRAALLSLVGNREKDFGRFRVLESVWRILLHSEWVYLLVTMGELRAWNRYGWLARRFWREGSHRTWSPAFLEDVLPPIPSLLREPIFNRISARLGNSRSHEAARASSDEEALVSILTIWRVDLELPRALSKRVRSGLASKSMKMEIFQRRSTSPIEFSQNWLIPLQTGHWKAEFPPKRSAPIY